MAQNRRLDGTRKRFLGRLPISTSNDKSSSNVPQVLKHETGIKNSLVTRDSRCHSTKNGNFDKATSSNLHKKNDNTFNSSFGGDFDNDFFEAVDKIEQEYNDIQDTGNNQISRFGGHEVGDDAKVSDHPRQKQGIVESISFKNNAACNTVKTLKKTEAFNTVNNSRKCPIINHHGKENGDDPNYLQTQHEIQAGFSRRDSLSQLHISTMSLNSPLQVSTPLEVKSSRKAKWESPNNCFSQDNEKALGNRSKKLERTNLFQNIVEKSNEKNDDHVITRDSGGQQDANKGQVVEGRCLLDNCANDKKSNMAELNDSDSQGFDTKQISTSEECVSLRETSSSHSPDVTVDQEETNTSARCKIGHSPGGVTEVSDRLNLASWGLPEAILNKYKEQGITTMFEWQAECLCTGKVLDDGNLVYSAPTSAGKTMVAELLMLKRVLETKKKAILILPFVSVAREKMFYLKRMFEDAGVQVDGYMGSQSPAGGLADVDVAVCTIEKANSLINRLMEEGSLGQLGVLVVDELHMLGDPHRGYLLELLLTKVRYVTQRAQAAPPGELKSTVVPAIQIIGMSATLPNLDLLARWLDADLYHTDFRPVPLTEMVKIGKEILDSNMKKIRDLDTSTVYPGDDDNVLPLCLETLAGGHSVLIFCPTKSWCEKLADTIAREFYNLNKQAQLQAQAESKEGQTSNGKQVLLSLDKLRDVKEQLKRCPAGLDTLLSRMVPCGVAYHHAGLTFDERDIVEGAFREGALRVLIATSTLSSGVNLPARRVIIRTPIFHGKIINTLTYKQMVGRAGRKGVDTIGESILVCKLTERAKATQLVTSQLPPVHSCLSLTGDGNSLTSSMKRAILEVIISGVAKSPTEVNTYAGCTLLAASMATEDEDADDGESSRQDGIQACVQFLQESEFITLRSVNQDGGASSQCFLPTQLGSAVLASALSPDEGLTVFAELQKARRCFVLENDLHTIYLVTPIYMSEQMGTVDWYQYLCLWERMEPGMRRVAELVGVQEGYLSRAARGRLPTKTAQQLRALSIHKRFYTALILNDLVNEVSLSTVARSYNCPRGMLQSLQQSAATFAGMVTVFCNRLGWHSLELLLTQFQSRLTFGVQRDLVDLVRVALLNAQRARILFRAGYQTVAGLATAKPLDVEQLLKAMVPFESKKQAEGESRWEAVERHKARTIWVTGHHGLTEAEAAVLIVQEAQQLLRMDLQQLGVQWRPQEDKKEEETKINPRKRRSSCLSLHSFSVGGKRNRSTEKKSFQESNRKRSISNVSDGATPNISILSPPPSLRLQKATSSKDMGPVVGKLNLNDQKSLPPSLQSQKATSSKDIGPVVAKLNLNDPGSPIPSLKVQKGTSSKYIGPVVAKLNLSDPGSPISSLKVQKGTSSKDLRPVVGKLNLNDQESSPPTLQSQKRKSCNDKEPVVEKLNLDNREKMSKETIDAKQCTANVKEAHVYKGTSSKDMGPVMLKLNINNQESASPPLQIQKRKSCKDIGPIVGKLNLDNKEKTNAEKTEANHGTAGLKEAHIHKGTSSTELRPVVEKLHLDNQDKMSKEKTIAKHCTANSKEVHIHKATSSKEPGPVVGKLNLNDQKSTPLFLQSQKRKSFKGQEPVVEKLNLDNQDKMAKENTDAKHCTAVLNGSQIAGKKVANVKHVKSVISEVQRKRTLSPLHRQCLIKKAKSPQQVAENICAPGSTANASDSSIELYSEPMEGAAGHNLSNDSFILDTQTLDLMGQFSPCRSKAGVKSDAINVEKDLLDDVDFPGDISDHNIQEVVCFDSSQDSLILALELNSESVQESEAVVEADNESPVRDIAMKIRTPNSGNHDDQNISKMKANPVTPPLYSEDLDSDIDSDMQQFMNNYHTQNHVAVVKAASPTVKNENNMFKVPTCKPALRRNNAINEEPILHEINGDPSSEPDAAIVDSDVDVDVDAEKRLDEAIIDGDSFMALDDSGDLLPASDYERGDLESDESINCDQAFAEDGFFEQTTQDLSLSLNHTQDVFAKPDSIGNRNSIGDASSVLRPNMCFAKNERKVDSGYCKSLAGHYTGLQEDLQLALNMSDTFSCSAMPGLEAPQITSKTDVRPTTAQVETAAGNSLTFSMMEREFDSDCMLEEDLVKADEMQIDRKAINLSPVEINKKPVRKGKRSSTNNSFDINDFLSVICDHTPNKKTSSCAPKRPRKQSVSDELNKTQDEEPEVVPHKTRKSPVTSKKDQKKKSSQLPTPAKLEGNADTSDCVPPTPPKDDKDNMSKVSTPNRLVGGVMGTPDKDKAKKQQRIPISQQSRKQKKVKSPRLLRSATPTPKKNPNSLKDTLENNATPRRMQVSPTRSSSRATALNASYSPSDLNTSLPLTNESFTIIDVASHKMLFEHFVEEWKEKDAFSLSLACDKWTSAAKGGPTVPSIGGKFQKAVTSKPLQRQNKDAKMDEDLFAVERLGMQVVGLAVSWDNRDAYYISLSNKQPPIPGDHDDSLAPPPLCEDLPVCDRLTAIKTILESSKATVMAFDLKAQYKLLCAGCGVTVRGTGADPKIADWLLDPEARERNLHRMVTNFLSLQSHMLDGVGSNVGLGSLGATPDPSTSSRVRAATECVLVRHLMKDHFQPELQKLEMLETFHNVEMPSLILLARMELNGMGFSETACEEQKELLLRHMSVLEEKAYKVVGHAFSLTSPDDISKVLFTELRLPPSGDPVNPLPAGSKRPLAMRSRGPQRYSTSKDILEKLKSLHPLPGIILEFRRINSALSKVVFPFQREKVYSPRLDMDRIHGVSHMHTATGRVTMHEPNLQNIPNDFEIQCLSDTEISKSATPGKSTRGQGSSRGQKQTTVAVSMRHSFIPFSGGVLLAADYSQLELRMIAHLSGDKKLASILNAGGDVFKTIAAQWKSVTPEDVTATQRQQAKQVCYGMIYGIGAKALAEQLSVDENEAAVFIETFKSKYTGMREYLSQTVMKCRERGFVETITGRRRYLPAIKDSNPHARAHAERQAVNTSVQGSAADLVKTAMIDVDRSLQRSYPDTIITHTHKASANQPQDGRRRSQRIQASSSTPRGAFFLLQLHDELIYEVNEVDIHQVAVTVKRKMENAIKLSVKLPVKLKIGPTWGTLSEMDL